MISLSIHGKILLITVLGLNAFANNIMKPPSRIALHIHFLFTQKVDGRLKIDMDNNNIQGEIIRVLEETEENNIVKIPLAIESGSRGWGFASPDSDYDCRFVYVHEKNWYLSVFDKPDIIEYTVDKVFDINGWDLRKFISHIVKSNAVMFEWLSSNEVYAKDEYVTNLLWDLAKRFFNPIAVSHHYLSIAKSKLSEVIEGEAAKLKNYFYILRPIANLNFIYQYNMIPHIEYFPTLSKTKVPDDILSEIMNLRKIKSVSVEGYKIERNELLIEYFESEIELFTNRLADMKYIKCKDYELADETFMKILEWVWTDEHK